MLRIDYSFTKSFDYRLTVNSTWVRDFTSSYTVWSYTESSSVIESSSDPLLAYDIIPPHHSPSSPPFIFNIPPP